MHTGPLARTIAGLIRVTVVTMHTDIAAQTRPSPGAFILVNAQSVQYSQLRIELISLRLPATPIMRPVHHGTNPQSSVSLGLPQDRDGGAQVTERASVRTVAGHLRPSRYSPARRYRTSAALRKAVSGTQGFALDSCAALLMLSRVGRCVRRRTPRRHGSADIQYSIKPACNSLGGLAIAHHRLCQTPQ